MEKVFGVVILYNPPVEIKQHISTYIQSLQKLFVFDNSEPASSIDWSDFDDKVVVVSDGVNKGIAERLNVAAELALKEGAAWLLTMDQDSYFPENALSNYLNCLNSLPDYNSIGMFGVEFERILKNFTCTFEKSDKLITSGSLVNLEVFQKIGGFDENLFIDEVDFEYCVRANKNGYDTLKFKNIYIHHSLGTTSTHRSLKSLKKTNRTLHSPLRLYYMVRNYLYVRQKHAHFSPSFELKKHDLLHRIKNNLLYGSEPFKVLKFVVLAYIDSKQRKMGKFSKPSK